MLTTSDTSRHHVCGTYHFIGITHQYLNLYHFSSYLQIEDAKKSLLLYGNKISQVMKDVLTDLHKIKRVRYILLQYQYQYRIQIYIQYLTTGIFEVISCFW